MVDKMNFNRAQQILLELGVDPIALIAHERGRLPSSRKKGPGRKHQQGKKREVVNKDTGLGT